MDPLIGGSGEDTAKYSTSQVSSIINLSTGLQSDALGPGDTLTGIENIRGSESGDLLIGSAGADRLTGGGGRDILMGLAGADVLDGGPDHDIVDYNSSPVGVTVDLGDGLAESGGDAAGDVLISIRSVRGSQHDDSIKAGSESNFVWGLDGNDSLSGEAGIDTMRGDQGQDTLTGGAGADGFEYLSTQDSLEGATLRDIITDFSMAQGDVIDLDAIDPTASSVTGSDSFTFIGTAAFSAEGQLRYAQNGTDLIVQMNTIGVSGAETELCLKNVASLTAAAFHL